MGRTVVKRKKTVNINYEVIGILIIALGILSLLGLYFDSAIGLFGRFIKEVLLGMIGTPALLIPPVIIIYGILVIFRKDHMIGKRIITASILFILISSLIQSASFSREVFEGLPPLDAIAKFYIDGQDILSGGDIFKGGILGGVISLPFLLVFQQTGTIILLTALAVVDLILLTDISIVAVFKALFKAILHSGRNHKPVAARSVSDTGFPKDDLLPDEDFLPLEKQKSKIIDFRIEKSARQKEEAVKLIEPVKMEKPAVIRKPASSNATLYRFPPPELMESLPENMRAVKNLRSQAIDMAKKLEDTLRSFGVEGRVVNVSRGPSVTRYELQPNSGVKVSKIVGLADDIALNLAAYGVRIEAPIPGKAAIGIEVPNKDVTLVHLREIIESQKFVQKESKLTFALGKDITGECIVSDIESMPHLLIAGATGSGKSKCLAGIILSILYKAKPEDVRMLLIDPKVVELGVYNGIPHLLVPVVTDPKKAAASLNWAVQEMTDRYKLFAEKGARDIKSYNDIMGNLAQGKMPQIVIIIDELSDLMMVAPAEVEDSICRLAQMARAAGMYLIIATQRPSVDVITGVIKANIPSRIAFAVSSQVDSRTILDMAGAEKLLGKGDMLFNPAGRQKPLRVQGAFASDGDIGKVVQFLKDQNLAEYDNGIAETIENGSVPNEGKPGENDELLPQAIEMVVELGQASVSFIQRKFKVGYARAARIIDQMEARGIVGGFDGSKPRQVLITKQQWYEMKM